MPRTKYLRNRRRRVDLTELQKYAAMTMGFLLIVFIIAQFIVLDLAGIHGPEITKLRAEQEDLKLEIELERAQMNELTKSDNVKNYASSNFGFRETTVKTIQLDNPDSSEKVTAQTP